MALPEMREWLRRAGYTPQDLTALRHIHVAGTKGKGSVCAFATGILRKYGRVGTYTSPHLVSVRERIAIDGEPVDQEFFTRSFFELWDRFTETAKREEQGKSAAEAEGPATKPFFFRFLTILAWHIFLQAKVDAVVLECGIGGEYDATNVLPPQAVSAAVVTQLGIDHVAMLGDTVEKIAWHKAGIFKSGVTAFTRKLDGQKSTVAAVLRERAVEKGAQLVEVDDAAVERWGGVPGRIVGGFQKYNQALAVMAVREHLSLKGGEDHLQDLPPKMTQGLQEATLRGRCEVIEQDKVKWHIDGAHTKDSLEQVAKWFSGDLDQNESAILIFNQQERNAAELLSHFIAAVRRFSDRGDIFHHAIFTRNDLEKLTEGEVRDMEVQQQAAELMSKESPECLVSVSDNIENTIAEAQRIASERGINKILVTGSLHLVGGILRVLEPESLL